VIFQILLWCLAVLGCLFVLGLIGWGREQWNKRKRRREIRRERERQRVTELLEICEAQHECLDRIAASYDRIAAGFQKYRELSVRRRRQKP